MRENKQRADMKLYHTEVILNPVFMKRTIDPESRIVHQDVDGEISLCAFLNDLLGRAAEREILWDHMDLDPVAALELSPEDLELLLSPRYQDEICAVPREEAGEISSDTR